MDTYLARITEIIRPQITADNATLMRKLIRAASAYEFASRHQYSAVAEYQMRRYERLTAQLGYDPLDR